ncbi:MAG TPA: universal stress protein [Solirubrobacteraceae bacterium]|jgi:nucleotide-binding universal stress UspA family protein|nr:universal stress protein [Solirubrobacteraceae bacterium]
MDHALASADAAVSPPLRAGPILVAYDGTPASDHAIREAGALLSGRPALVVTVCKPGLGFELLEQPAATLGLPPAPLDVRTALEIDRQLCEAAQRAAERGAARAREAGFAVERLAVAEDVEITVAETILRVARGRDSQAIVLGIESHGRLGGVILGKTSRDVIRHAPCPVLVTRMAPDTTRARPNQPDT